MTTEMAFTRTAIWQKTLGERKNDREEKARTRLREAFRRLREKVAWLVSLIAKDMPDYTVHDISHLEAIWEMADIIAGPDYPLNPAEAFVLGGSILLHDAGMCLAAYPGGMQDIAATPQWRDSVAVLLSAHGTDVKPEAITLPPEEIKKPALQQTLRLLHHKKAEELPTQKWRNSNTGEDYYLLNDEDIRSHYGSVIGQIAKSHWWDVKDLEKLTPRQLTAMGGLPNAWVVDPVKVACLLRAADAAHIDQRRAPHFLQALLQPAGEAAKHWSFQSKVGKPVLLTDTLIYSSGQPFALHDYESWWLCYQMLNMIDRELRLVDILLEETHRPRFVARGVKGAESPESAKQYITTSGWEPLDTRLHISDVGRVVEMLGGKQLYGDRPWIAVRELIQNAADAVRARRKLEARTDNWGEIEVTLDKDAEGHWLHVTDNGVGMSPKVMTRALLDFGKSFWRSTLVAEEFPGLQGSGMEAIGRFGIGFFSVFMLGKYVRVISRRFDWGAEKSYVLEFRNRLQSPPLLRFTTPEERQLVRDGGTQISIKLEDDPYSEGHLLSGRGSRKTPLSVLVSHLCPALDVTLKCDENRKKKVSVTARDWTNLPVFHLLSRVNPYMVDDSIALKFANSASLVRDEEGQIFGRGWVYPGPRYDLCGAVTVGGLHAGMLKGLGGIWIADIPLTVRRNEARPSVPAQLLQAWAKEQAKLIAGSDIKEEDQLECARIILACGADVDELPFCRNGRQYLNSSKLKARIAKMTEIHILSEARVTYDEDWDSVPPRDFEDGFKLAGDATLFLAEADTYEFSSHSSLVEDYSSMLFRSRSKWPYDLPDYPGNHPHTPYRLLLKVVKEIWGEFDTEENVDAVVGEVNSVEITRDVEVLTRSDV